MRVSKETLDAFQEKRRQRIIAVAAELFMENGIGGVSIKKISDAVEIPTASINRYFASTADLLTQSVTYLIEDFYRDMRKRYTLLSGENFTAFQEVEFFLESFIYAFEHNRSFLKLTLDFDIYVNSHEVPQEAMVQYFVAMSKFLTMFTEGFAKGETDGTIKSSLLKDDIFFTCFHVMLAVVQKYSYGNTHPSPQGDDFAEMLLLKKMILDFIKPSDCVKELHEKA